MASGNGKERRPARPLTTEEVTIQTATIEVRTLMLGKRQVTLSVFRQLVREQIVEPETLALRGEAWGLINYFPGACLHDFDETSSGGPKFLGEHLHVVWQRDGLLRRACVGPDGPLPLYRRRSDLAARRHTKFTAPVVLTALLQGRLTGVERDREDIILAAAGRRLRICGGDTWPIRHDEATRLLEGTPFEEPRKQPAGACLDFLRARREDARKEAVRAVRTELAFLGHEPLTVPACKELAKRDPLEPAFAEELGGQAADARAQGLAARERLAWAEKEWPPVYEGLEALDQLFIAV
jgi:hypothetical protein